LHDWIAFSSVNAIAGVDPASIATARRRPAAADLPKGRCFTALLAMRLLAVHLPMALSCNDPGALPFKMKAMQLNECFQFHHNMP
jgi:hypothetical protein